MPYILLKFCMEICPVEMKGKSEYLKVMGKAKGSGCNCDD